MNPHAELELLGPYFDGELSTSERARVEAHAVNCAECRTTLAALRATVAELRTLPEPAPTPQDSWALRAAIRRARSPMRRWQRVSWAAGAVAAAAIAFAALTLPGNGDRTIRETSADSLAGGPGPAAGVPVFRSDDDLSAPDAQGRLLAIAGVGGRAVSPVPTAPESLAGEDASGVVVAPTATTYSAYAASAEERAAIDRCAGVVRSSIQEFLEPIRYEVATFESKPAFLLFFRTSARYELWVVGRSDCGVLYFGQAGG